MAIILHQKNLLRALALALSYLPFVSFAHAELPRFDGIYLTLTNGESISLPTVNTSQERICDAPNPEHNTLDENGEYYNFTSRYPRGSPLSPPVYLPNCFEYLFFDYRDGSSTRPSPAEFESIFVRSRQEQLTFVEYIAHPIDFFSPRANALARFVPSNLSPTRREQALALPSSFGNDYVGARCGWNPRTFNVLNESETTYQYFFTDGQRGALRTASSVGQCGQGNIVAYGLLIHTNQNKYIVWFSQE